MSLTVEAAASEAVARWLGRTAQPGRHCLRTTLPVLDFPHFFRVLASQLEHEARNFAFCVAGFDLDEPAVQAMTDRAGLSFHAVATHLQRAAEWRNRSEATILALARGEPDGGNTIQEFANASSTELARILLAWVADPEHEFSDTRRAPELHGKLLKLLSEIPPAGIVLSLEGVCRFVATWAVARASNDAQVRNDAPLGALSELGLAWDGDLFATRELRDNLKRSLESTQEVLSLSDKHLQQLATRIEQGDAAERPAFRVLLAAIGDAQRGCTAERLRAIRLDHWRKLRTTRPNRPEPRPEATLDWSDVEREVITLLLTRNTAQCESLYTRIAGTDAIQGFRVLPWDFGEGEETLSLATLRPEGEALLGLADSETWGGAAHFLREQPTPALLCQLGTSRLTRFRTTQVVFTDDQTGETYTLLQLLTVWDDFKLQALVGDVPLIELWNRWNEARSALLPSQEWLFLSPLTLLAGDPSAREQAKAVLDASSALFARIALAREAMLNAWQAGAEALFQALLALDIVQIRIITNRSSSAANRLILLPSHPIQLWRSYSFVTKCLEVPGAVDEKTREAIVASLNRADLYLPAWFASRLPQNEGANKLLPFAGVLGGLAVFQNLENAVASMDGAQDIQHVLVRFAAIHPEFCRPMRVTVVNPPDPERLLPTLARCLEEPKGPERLEIRFVATARLRSRLAEAQRLYLAAGGEMGDAIDSGQLAIEFGNLAGEGSQLEELVREVSRTPCHILVVFDEADLELQRRALRGDLPMSPFTVTRDLRQVGPPAAPRLELQPTFTEALFTGMQRLINAVDGSQGDSLAANVNATNYLGAINTALQVDAPAAIWLVVADRTLPSVVTLHCQPLLLVRHEIREVGVFCRDLTWLARRVRIAFGECNLDLHDVDLTGLLRDGASMLAGGLLDLVQVKDAAPNRPFVYGMAGALFVARAWKMEHPNGLLLSVDSPVARSWLGLGNDSLRSDLLGLWEHEGNLEIEIIEVKTSHDPMASAVIEAAVVQVTTTLTATEHGLNGTDVLAVPRREMLKEVLKQAVDVAPFESDPTVRREHQREWISWLLRLFGESSQRPAVRLKGRVVCVHLRDRNPPSAVQRMEGSWSVHIEYLGEERCLELGLGRTQASRSSPRPSDMPRTSTIIPSTPQETPVVLPHEGRRTESEMNYPTDRQYNGYYSILRSPAEGHFWGKGRWRHCDLGTLSRRSPSLQPAHGNRRRLRQWQDGNPERLSVGATAGRLSVPRIRFQGRLRSAGIRKTSGCHSAFCRGWSSGQPYVGRRGSANWQKQRNQSRLYFGGHSYKSLWPWRHTGVGASKRSFCALRTSRLSADINGPDGVTETTCFWRHKSRTRAVGICQLGRSAFTNIRSKPFSF